MAQYNISASGNQLIIELIVTDGDFAPSIVSLKTPSIKLTTDRIKLFDSAVYNMALLFDQINEIDGVAPTDLEDAADKIIALIANFNGGGAAPYKVYTALLTQSGTDAPVATVLQNTLGGDIVWTRNNIGDYNGELPYSVDLLKATIPNGTYYNSLSGVVTSVEFLNENNIRISSEEEINASTGTNLTASDGYLFNNLIEIIIYN